MEIRPYQQAIIEQARALMQKGVRSILIQAPTGSGKTMLTAKMLKTSSERGYPCWFINHRRELTKQSIRAFAEAGITPGVVAAGFHPDLRATVQICSIQTLARRYKRMRRPRLIVWDESHHVAAGSWSQIFRDIPEAFHIGLTATPQRLDGRGLGEFFSEMINGPSVASLIDDGFLAPYRLFAPSTVNTADIGNRAGDFATDQLARVVDKPTITGNAITHYIKHAPGRRAVVFCVSIEHSKHVVAQFQAAGINAAHVDGETNVELRDDAIERFKRGQIRVISNVDLFGEGFDLPSLEVAILLRPTQSLGLYLQQVGRSLRPCVGKTEAIILDHAGNVHRHGLPDDERVWSLAGGIVRRRGDGDTLTVRVCPRCYAAQSAGQPRCRYCGTEFIAKPREVQQVDGELVAVDGSVARRERAQEQAAAVTENDLYILGLQRGYGPRARRWAHHVFQARQRKRLQGRMTA